MIFASGNSPRIATIASKPFISGICKSISVTSGRCVRNCWIVSRLFEASATRVLSRWVPTSYGDALPYKGMFVNVAPANTAVFAWVAAYDSVVDVVCYGTSGSNNTSAVWNAYLAQTTEKIAHPRIARSAS
jgi:hypothetical protein